ncbi:MAG: glycoside hydrolase family 3 C-terminal domain-containing protein [Desulfosudaceae bacterium]
MTDSQAKKFEVLVRETDGDLDSRVEQLLSAMTLADKINQMSGNAHLLDIAIMLVRYNLTTYDSGRDRRLGIPALRFTDGPHGAGVGRSTCFPVAMARGATWDPALEKRVGEAMGKEARAQGANFFAGVCVNVVRHPGWGRAQESFGEDPHHLGEMGAATIKGAGRHALTCVKHLACNSIDESRFYVDVQIDERALREVYLPHFKKCVQAGVSCVMSAYNRVNGEYCGHHKHLLTDILKKEWGFDGFVMSDFCYGVYDGRAGVSAGLDMEMPHTKYYGRRLLRHVKQKEVPAEAVHEAAFRILRQKLAFAARHQSTRYPRETIACSAHRELAYEVACKSLVLLKNTADVLPLDKNTVKTIAVLGGLSGKANLGDKGSSCVRPPYAVTPLEGIKRQAGPGTKVLASRGNSLARARQIAAKAEVTIVVAGLTHKEEGEYFPHIRGGDRERLGLPEKQERLIRAVCEQNTRCVVVLEGGSVISMEGWIKNAAAVLMAWYPGMEGGNAIADILFGNVNPSGKLPLTFFQSEAQLFEFDKRAKTVTYDLYHGYRYADRNRLKPAFYFGFGLSYTTFARANLKLARRDLTEEEVLTAHVDITNTGRRSGEEIVQLYIGYPGTAVPRPVKELKAFARVALEPAETRTVELTVPVRELAFYDPVQQRWEVEKGDHTVLVGPSSDPADLVLSETFSVIPQAETIIKTESDKTAPKTGLV